MVRLDRRKVEPIAARYHGGESYRDATGWRYHLTATAARRARESGRLREDNQAPEQGTLWGD